MEYCEMDVENFLVEHNALEEQIGIVVLEQQYRTELGIIDILGYDKEDNALVVVELKKELVDEAAVGQILKYMAAIVDIIDYSKHTGEKIFGDTEDVRGLLIGHNCTPGVKAICSKFKNLSYRDYEASFDVAIFPEINYMPRQGQVETDFNKAKEHLQEVLERVKMEPKTNTIKGD